MELNESDLFDSAPWRAPWSDLEGFKRHLDASRNYIPNVNMGELQAEIEAQYAKDLEAERKAAMGDSGDYSGFSDLEFDSESESESESDFNKDAVQEEAFREAKKDPSQPDSHDSTEEEEEKQEGCLLASRE